MKHFAALLAGLAALALPPLASADEQPITSTAQSGETMEAFEGTFAVPERRANPDSRELTLHYVRFPATGETAGPPIIYLAGGPGGSGISTAEGRRFPLFMAMREFGDVIAFDQRGTGRSRDIERCDSGVPDRADEVLTDEEIAESRREAIAACADIWTAQGVDILGYTTLESAHDLSDLREHLGAERISLWGISYGSHLAMAAIDAIPRELERVIIASAEGLDQTVKLPAETDAYFARIQAAIETQPAARERYGDVAVMMRRVQAELEADPILISLSDGEGGTADFLITRQIAQQVASALIADPGTVGLLLQVYEAMAARNTAMLTPIFQRFADTDPTITLDAMSTLMDVASGISEDRLALFEVQAPNGIVGRYLNFPMPQATGVIDGLDLGPDFRDGPHGDVPVLLLTGTLDGRTYIAEQAAAVAGLSDVTQVMVVNAGHNLFMTTPEVGEVMGDFMRGDPVRTLEITVELPDFTVNPFGG